MTRDEAMRFLDQSGSRLRVVTRSGVEYDVDRDAIEVSTEDTGYYVYGYRVKAGGTPMKRIPAGTVRWFSLLNVTPASSGDET